MSLITLENLAIGYKNKVVKSGLTAEIRSGQLTALIGTNGMGKSTLLRTIAALQPCKAGHVTFKADGGHAINLDTLTPGELARMVSVVLTERPDARLLTVRQVVAMGRLPYTGFFGRLTTADEMVVDKTLQVTELTHFANRQFDALSDGERQKVMIAKALAQQTPIIILDEPTAYLDYPSKVQTMVMLRRLANQLDKIVLLSTHDLELAFKHADRLLSLRHNLAEYPKERMRDYIRDLNDECHCMSINDQSILEAK